MNNALRLGQQHKTKKSFGILVIGRMPREFVPLCVITDTGRGQFKEVVHSLFTQPELRPAF